MSLLEAPLPVTTDSGQSRRIDLLVAKGRVGDKILDNLSLIMNTNLTRAPRNKGAGNTRNYQKLLSDLSATVWIIEAKKSTWRTTMAVGQLLLYSNIVADRYPKLRIAGWGILLPESLPEESRALLQTIMIQARAGFCSKRNLLETGIGLRIFSG